MKLVLSAMWFFSGDVVYLPGIGKLFIEELVSHLLCSSQSCHSNYVQDNVCFADRVVVPVLQIERQHLALIGRFGVRR
ncbi:MAG: hypothetical protein DI556_22750 [Rhodovulum sulfidophilum]|uniref:Uncharacterized protein n=1 Tax=Rhodovulum sulfidophilum TaxID=35806 RepID=A0A2W5MYH1_RHOSU|nr:MAG: hypothetical protein DI556_22750 [Rhodovulum sulfidophilum]